MLGVGVVVGVGVGVGARASQRLQGSEIQNGVKKHAKPAAKHRFSYKTIDFTRRLLILSSKSSRFASSFDQK